MLTGEYTSTHRCSVAPTHRWAQTPSLLSNCSWIPAIPVAGSWSCESVKPTAPLCLLVLHTHVKARTELTGTLSLAGSRSTHTLTHTCAGSQCFTAARQGLAWSHLGLAWSITHWGLPGHWPPDTQLSPAAGTIIHPWPRLTPPTHWPLKLLWGHDQESCYLYTSSSVCPLTPLFSQSYSFPNHLNPSPFSTSDFFPKHPMVRLMQSQKALPQHPITCSTALGSVSMVWKGIWSCSPWPVMMRVIPGHCGWAFPETALSLCSPLSCTPLGSQWQGSDGLVTPWGGDLGTVMSKLFHLPLSLYSFVNV